MAVGGIYTASRCKNERESQTYQLGQATDVRFVILEEQQREQGGTGAVEYYIHMHGKKILTTSRTVLTTSEHREESLGQAA